MSKFWPCHMYVYHGHALYTDTAPHTQTNGGGGSGMQRQSVSTCAMCVSMLLTCLPVSAEFGWSVPAPLVLPVKAGSGVSLPAVLQGFLERRGVDIGGGFRVAHTAGLTDQTAISLISKPAGGKVA